MIVVQDKRIWLVFHAEEPGTIEAHEYALQNGGFVRTGTRLRTRVRYSWDSQERSESERIAAITMMREEIAKELTLPGLIPDYPAASGRFIEAWGEGRGVAVLDPEDADAAE